MYKIRFLDPGERAMQKFDRSVTTRVLRKLRWLAANADNVEQEGLHGEFAGFGKLREGDYRIIYKILKSEQIIEVTLIGHRSEVYKK